MEVVALVPGRDHPSTRYRIALFAEELALRGWRLSIKPIARHPLERLQQLSSFRRDQVVILQRKLLPVWQTMLLRQRVGSLVYDFDDAVFYRDSFHPRGPNSWTRALRFHATVALADLVVAGNTYLADHACRWTSPRKVEVIPTCVDANRYRLAPHHDRRPTRLVWIGSSSTVQALDAARPLLEEIGEAVPQTRLRVICDRFPRLRHLEVESIPWSSEVESEGLRESDIGISWLADDAWSRGKCGLKILQYMAAGLPVVASPVGVHREIIGQESGFLPTTRRGWVETMARLVRDPDLRHQMGQAGRRCIERRFTPSQWGDVWAGRLHETLARA